MVARPYCFPDLNRLDIRTKPVEPAFGRSLWVVTAAPVGQVECKRLVIGWSVAMQMGGEVECNLPLYKESHFSRVTSELASEERAEGR